MSSFYAVKPLELSEAPSFKANPGMFDHPVAVAMAEAANEVKGGDIRVLCVKPLVYWTRFFVIATGFSRPQVDAIGYEACVFLTFL